MRLIQFVMFLSISFYLSASEFDLNQWLNFYYKNPAPERVLEAIKIMKNSGIFEQKNAIEPAAVFFSHIFRMNPSKLDEWFIKINTYNNSIKKLFYEALWWSNTDKSKKMFETWSAESAENKSLFSAYLKPPPMPILSLPLKSPAVLDLLWASFSATGDEAYIKRIIECATMNPSEGLTGLVVQSAKWSLRSNCEQDENILKIAQSALITLEDAKKDILKEIIKDL